MLQRAVLTGVEKLQRFDEPRGPGANGTRRLTVHVQLLQVTDNIWVGVNIMSDRVDDQRIIII